MFIYHLPQNKRKQAKGEKSTMKEKNNKPPQKKLPGFEPAP